MGIGTFCNVMWGRTVKRLRPGTPVDLDTVVAEAKAAFDDSCRTLVGSTYAPNRVTVRFAPEDGEYHAPLMKRFRRHVALVLRERVENRELDLLGRQLEVRFEQSDEVEPGIVMVEASFDGFDDEEELDDALADESIVWDVEAYTDEGPMERADGDAEAARYDDEDDDEDDIELLAEVSIEELSVIGEYEGALAEAPAPEEHVPSAASMARMMAEGPDDDDPDAMATALGDDRHTRCVANQAVFEVVGGPQRGATHMLADGIYLVGRHHACEVQLPAVDDLASRRHLRIIVRGETVAVDDLQSGNGLYVNGKRVHHARLSSGDVVRAGRTDLRLTRAPEGWA